MVIVICDDINEVVEDHKERILKLAKKNDVPVTFRVFHSGDELVKAYKKSKFEMDLLYLDVHMPGMNGDEALAELRKIGYHNDVVFFTVSTNPEHFKKAFKYDALEYIMKNKHSDKEMEDIFNKAVEAHNEREQEFITLTFGSEVVSIVISDIYYFELVKRKINVHYGNSKPFVFYDTLSRIEKLLDFHGFLAIKGFLINMNKIASIKSGEILLKNGEIIMMSKRKTAECAAIFKEYIGIGEISES